MSHKHMQVHQLARASKQFTGQRVGRGGKRGTTSGRGTKGQRARAGAKIRPAIRDIIKKIPKKRGYQFRSFRTEPVLVNCLALGKYFSDGDVVSRQTLLEKKLIKRRNGKIPLVKVIGGGGLEKKLFLKGIFVSASVREKISAAGGQVA